MAVKVNPSSINRKKIVRQAGIAGMAGRQAGRQTGKQTGRHTERQRDSNCFV